MVRIISVTLCCLFAVSNAWAAEKQDPAKADTPPVFFKVYSKDGRESLTATCLPKNLSVDPKSATEVTCKFVNVRFTLPESLGATTFPSSLEELEDIAESRPQFAEEIKKDPKLVSKAWREAISQLKENVCSFESRKTLEPKMRDPSIGPKRKRFFEGIIEACSDKDPNVLPKRLNYLKARTCGLWVDHFSLDFKKLGEGRWLYTQKSPGLLSQVLKVYELTGDGLAWTLIETRVPMTKTQGEAAQEEPQRTVWSWKNYSEYEIPPQCEFISHNSVGFP